MAKLVAEGILLRGRSLSMIKLFLRNTLGTWTRLKPYNFNQLWDGVKNNDVMYEIAVYTRPDDKAAIT